MKAIITPICRRNPRTPLPLGVPIPVFAFSHPVEGQELFFVRDDTGETLRGPAPLGVEILRDNLTREIETNNYVWHYVPTI